VGAGVGTAVALIVGLAAGMVAAGYAWVAVRKGLAASRHHVRSGSEGLVGRVGEVRAAPAPEGQVFLDGALWRARVWPLTRMPRCSAATRSWWSASTDSR